MRLCHIALACLILVPVVSMAANQVYRWKDANGVVHFADAPPPHGTNYKVINVDTGTARDPVAPAPAASVPKPAADAAASSKTVADTPENRAKLCAQLQSNIDVLKSSQIVTGSPDSTTPMTAEERASRLATAESQFKAFCSN